MGALEGHVAVIGGKLKPTATIRSKYESASAIAKTYRKESSD